MFMTNYKTNNSKNSPIDVNRIVLLSLAGIAGAITLIFELPIAHRFPVVSIIIGSIAGFAATGFAEYKKQKKQARQQKMKSE